MLEDCLIGGVRTIVLPRSVLVDDPTDPPDVRISALTVPSDCSIRIGRVASPAPRLTPLTVFAPGDVPDVEVDEPPVVEPPVVVPVVDPEFWLVLFALDTGLPVR